MCWGGFKQTLSPTAPQASSHESDDFLQLVTAEVASKKGWGGEGSSFVGSVQGGTPCVGVSMEEVQRWSLEEWPNRIPREKEVWTLNCGKSRTEH